MELQDTTDKISKDIDECEQNYFNRIIDLQAKVDLVQRIRMIKEKNLEAKLNLLKTANRTLKQKKKDMQTTNLQLKNKVKLVVETRLV